MNIKEWLGMLYAANEKSFFSRFFFFFNTDMRKVKLIWKYAQNFPPEPHGVSFMHVSIWIILIN